MGHVLAIRSDNQSAFSKDSFSNPFILGAVVLTFLLQFIVTYCSFFHPIFHTENLSMVELIVVISASSIVFFAVEIEKRVFKKNRAIQLTVANTNPI